MYVHYNTINKGYYVPMVFERINFNVNFLLLRRSSKGRKVMERLRDAYGNENPGRKNPKSYYKISPKQTS